MGNLFAGLPKNPFNPNPTAVSNPSVTLNDNLRGLNQSFMAAAKEALARDPAADFSKLFAQYSKHLASFNATKETAPVESESHSSAQESAQESDESMSDGESEESEASHSSESESDSASNDSDVMIIEDSPKKQTESAPKFAFTAQGFSFSTQQPKAAAEAETKPVTADKLSTEEAEAQTEQKPFTFGASSESKPFTFSSSATESKPFTFTASATESKPFTFNSSATESKPFTFGSTATESKPFTFGTTATESKPFTFSSAATESKPFTSKPFEFQKSTSESADKPFTFSSTLPSFGTASTLPSFSFGSAANANTSAANSDAEDSEIPAEEAESFNLTRTSSEQLKTGAGEENETCQQEERCKIYQLNSQTKEWIDLGVAIFKINRFKNVEGKSRILCRAEGSGKVTLNVLITAKGTEANLPEGKKEIALICVGPNGLPEKYLVRVKTVEQAVALNSALQTEIIYVQSFKP